MISLVSSLQSTELRCIGILEKSVTNVSSSSSSMNRFSSLLKAGNKKEAAKNYKLASAGLKANKSEEFLIPHWGTDEVKRSMAKTQ